MPPRVSIPLRSEIPLFPKPDLRSWLLLQPEVRESWSPFKCGQEGGHGAVVLVVLELVWCFILYSKQLCLWRSIGTDGKLQGE